MPTTGLAVWVFQIIGDSRCNGIGVWQNDENHHIINQFTDGGIDHGVYGNHFEYINVDGPYFNIHAAGVSIRESRIEVVEAFWPLVGRPPPTVIFANVRIDRSVVNNGNENGETPGQYLLNGTGLACGDIEYHDAVSGIQVIIDGEVF